MRADSLLAPAYVVLGRARSTLGEDAAAVDPLRKAVYLDPTAGDAHFLLGGALSRLGQHGGAAVSYRAAAASLQHLDDATRRDLLGGRDLAELVDLCETLAESAAALAGGGVPARCSRGRVVSGWVTFVMGSREMAGALDEVREVVRATGLEELTGTRAPVTSLLELRGTPVPVVDLRSGADPADDGDILVLSTPQGVLGLAVDRVSSVLGPDDLVPPDPIRAVPAGPAGVRRGGPS